MCSSDLGLDDPNDFDLAGRELFFEASEFVRQCFGVGCHLGDKIRMGSLIAFPCRLPFQFGPSTGLVPRLGSLVVLGHFLPFQRFSRIDHGQVHLGSESKEQRAIGALLVVGPGLEVWHAVGVGKIPSRAGDIRVQIGRAHV